MMILLNGIFRIPAERLEEARPIMAAAITGSRAEAGCLQYDYAEDVLEPGLIRVTERWVDRASLLLHFTTPHIRQWRASWEDLGINGRDLTLYETNEGEPI